MMIIKITLSILAFLCLVIAYGMSIETLDRAYPALSNWLWVSSAVPIIVAAYWVLLSPVFADKKHHEPKRKS